MLSKNINNKQVKFAKCKKIDKIAYKYKTDSESEESQSIDNHESDNEEIKLSDDDEEENQQQDLILDEKPHNDLISESDGESVNPDDIIINYDDDDEEEKPVVKGKSLSSTKSKKSSEKVKAKAETSMKKSRTKKDSQEKEEKSKKSNRKVLLPKGKPAESIKPTLKSKEKYKEPSEKLDEKIYKEYIKILIELCEPKAEPISKKLDKAKREEKQQLINIVEKLKKSKKIDELPKDFFKYYDIKKNIENDDFIKYFTSKVINTVNIIKFSSNLCKEDGFNKDLYYSEYGDLDILYKRPIIDINMRKYCSVILTLAHVKYYSIYTARCNWLKDIPDKVKEILWKQAKENIDETDKDNEVITIFKSLMNSNYVKYIFMYNYPGNSIFDKMLKQLLNYKDFQEELTDLFENELKPISWLFSLVHFSYRGITYADGQKGLARVIHDEKDNALFNPDNLIIIGKLIEDNYRVNNKEDNDESE